MSLNARKNILVISVHPDDEALGCAGTILKHADAGANIFWGVVTNVKEDYGYATAVVNKRNSEIQTVSEKLHCKELLNLELRPAGLTTQDIPEIAGAFGSFVKNKNIDTIYCVNRSDAHSDHRVAFEACSVLIKSFRYPTVKRFLSYECLSETEFAPPLPEKVFLPNFHVDISAQWKRKMDIVEVYSSELGEHPFPRSRKSIEALAVLRGSYAGCAYAEAFQILKDSWS